MELKTKNSAGKFWEAYFLIFKLLKLLKKRPRINFNKCFLTHRSQKKDVRVVASVRARARGRLGIRVWRCVGAYESATFFHKKKLFDQNVFQFFFFFLIFYFLLFF